MPRSGEEGEMGSKPVSPGFVLRAPDVAIANCGGSGYVSLRCVGLAVVLFLVSSCMSWERSTAPPATAIAEDPPSAVRLTLRNGSVATIRSPLIRNDSILSESSSVPGVAIADVEALEMRRLSAGRTLGLAAAGVVGAALWTVGVTGSGGSSEVPGPLPKITPTLLDGIGWFGWLIAGP